MFHLAVDEVAVVPSLRFLYCNGRHLLVGSQAGMVDLTDWTPEELVADLWRAEMVPNIFSYSKNSADLFHL